MATDEQKPILTTPSPQHGLLLTALFILSMGDAVEFYLAGILTPAISCDLSLGETKYGALNVLFYAGYCTGEWGDGSRGRVMMLI